MSADAKPSGEDSQKSSLPAADFPAVSLPKGGGAIRGIDEKFTVNPASGTASFSLPLPLSPGRSGLTPPLALAYDSGAGNSPFGLGWALTLPSISRKTDKGLPRYWGGEGSDVFIISGAEDLVPSTQADGTRDTFTRDGHRVDRFRPRIEGLFARIERWTRLADGDAHWRVTASNNVTTSYGLTAAARIADPADSRRIFQWFAEETRDDKGNILVYEYKPENASGVDPSRPEEKNRLAAGFAQKYLKRVFYANRRPFVAGDWCFEFVLDYGEHGDVDPGLELSPWPAREDPFSTHRPSFEVRTHRLCRRALLFHHFPKLGGRTLVKSLSLAYTHQPEGSLLMSATLQGHIREGLGYQSQSLPPLEFSYTALEFNDTVLTADAEGLGNLPFLDASQYQWVDLDGEGISGVLSDQHGAWFYQHNQGSGKLGPAQPVRENPIHPSAGARLLDVQGNSQLALVEFRGATAGLCERDHDGRWAGFVPFASQPQVSLDDPRVRFIDLNGDGRADLLVDEDYVFRWYPSLGRKGFGSAEMAERSPDEERSPRLVYNDPQEIIFFADMDGDGLADVVRIRNGEICYWPNQGYGRFGAKVSMDAAPVFADPAHFNSKFLRLADLDGSGPADIVYLSREGADLYRNFSGNHWSERIRLSFPSVDDLSQVQILDFLGTGTACLVWSSLLPGDAGRQVRYLDLLNGKKPWLLETVSNNLGAFRRLTYAPSTKYYLEDQAAGIPWATKLPFPVHVVASVEVRDEITGMRFTSHYRFRHGFYDGDEREFRGFGYVEQQDTEDFETLAAAGGPPLERTHYQPPVLTKSWFHTGAYFEGERIARQFEREYYAGDTHPQAAPLADTAWPPLLSARERREAARALKGSLLRQEVYALDGDAEKETHPYTVTENAFSLRLLQPQGRNRHGVFLAHSRESISFHYERIPTDPRVAHQLSLEVDAYGNVIQSLTVGYPRRSPAFPEQGRLTITYTENDLLHRPDEVDWYRLDLPSETRAYELTGVTALPGLLRSDDLIAAAATAVEIPYESQPTGTTLQKRLLHRTRQTYWSNDLTRELAFGEVESLALPCQSYSLAFTPGFLAGIFEGVFDEPPENLLREGGHIQLAGTPSWWIPSGQTKFDRTKFYLPIGFTDAFGNQTAVFYDSAGLLVERSEGSQDPLLNNVVQAENDYRLLSPWQVTDPNGNRAAAAFDALGRVTATALMGKEGSGEGDTLASPSTQLEYRLDTLPVSVRTLARERHQDPATRWQEAILYSDGFGRTLQVKTTAEPDPETGAPRWIGTGRTIYNNKGAAIKQYEPYFSAIPVWENEAALVEQGVSPVFHYDPIGRSVRTDFPDGTFSRVSFDPWQHERHDQNDTVLESAWYRDRGRPDPASPDEPGDPETRAAWLAAQHANTPAVAHLDALGRTFLAESDNGPGVASAGRFSRTRTELDLGGQILAIDDPRGNQIITYVRDSLAGLRTPGYDLAGRPLYQKSPDSGERWVLTAADGKTLRSRDSLGRIFRHSYDSLRRVSGLFVQEAGAAETCLERIQYGEAEPDALRFNLRGKARQIFDSAGVATSEAFDFKGNLLRASLRLAVPDPDHRPDWNHAPELEAETFVSLTEYDALNRATRTERRRGDTLVGETIPAYSEAGWLTRVDARGRGVLAPFVRRIAHDAKGQRTQIEYGNGVQTTYTYDPKTYRLTNLVSTRPTGDNPLQALTYTYDPVGNILEIQDSSQPRVFFRNAVVEARSRYRYDALYRLLSATGREHAGLGADRQWDEDEFTVMPLPQDNDSQALRRYTENYIYDEAGNITALNHVADRGTWTRYYNYAADSNRLLGTGRPGDLPEGTYDYDLHGNMTRMPHLPRMTWDAQDRLWLTERQSGTGAATNPTRYIYNAGGDRIRKITEKNDGTLVEERIYLGGWELYRKSQTGVLVLERETLHIMDDQRRIALLETLTLDATATASLPGLRVRYQLDNHLGSACLEVDDSAEARIISYEEYHPYGTTAYHSGTGAVETSAKRYRYTGMERDEETGLNYHGARYYATWLGRWTAADPAGLKGGSNVYEYAYDNPIRFSDPGGKQVPQHDDEIDVITCAAPHVTVTTLPEVHIVGDPYYEINRSPYFEFQGGSGTPESYRSMIHQLELQMSLGGSRPLIEFSPTPDTMNYFYYDILRTELFRTWYFEGFRGVMDRYGEAGMRQLVVWLVPESREEARVYLGLIMSLIPSDIAPAPLHEPGGSSGGRSGSSRISEAEPVSGTRRSTTSAHVEEGGIAPHASAEPPVAAHEATPSPVETAPPPAAPSPSVAPDVPVGALRRWRITPGTRSRGVTRRIYREMRDWAQRRGTMDGPPTTGDVHAGHDYGSSHVFTPPGTRTRVGAQTAQGNLSQASSEAAAAAARRAWNLAHPGGPQLPVRPLGSR